MANAGPSHSSCCLDPMAGTPHHVPGLTRRLFSAAPQGLGIAPHPHLQWATGTPMGDLCRCTAGAVFTGIFWTACCGRQAVCHGVRSWEGGGRNKGVLSSMSRCVVLLAWTVRTPPCLQRSNLAFPGRASGRDESTALQQLLCSGGLL